MGRADVVAGADSLEPLDNGSMRAMNVQLSQDETYGDIIPVTNRVQGGIIGRLSVEHWVQGLLTLGS